MVIKMKVKKLFRKYPYLLMIIISAVFLSVLGFAGRDSIYKEYTVKLTDTPRLAVVFQGVGEGIYPWTVTAHEENTALASSRNTRLISKAVRGGTSRGVSVYTEKNTAAAANEAENVSDAIAGVTASPVTGIPDKKAEIEKESSGTGSKNAKAEQKSTENENNEGKTDSFSGDIEADKITENETAKENRTSSSSNKNNPEQLKDTAVSEDKAAGGRAQEDRSIGEEEERYQFETVTRDYFDDALFIGDSRTVGLSEYSDLSNSTFYADVGLTIYDIFDKKIAELEGSKVTIPEAFKVKQFKKIYIMLGINELGRGTTETFVEEYKKVIARVQELEPDALIFVEGIMNVSKEKSDKDPIFNNTNIKEKNDNIALLADSRKIFYIDVNEAITDKTGNLPSKYTFDYIHLKAAYYQIWTDFLLNHGVKTEE